MACCFCRTNQEPDESQQPFLSGNHDDDTEEADIKTNIVNRGKVSQTVVNMDPSDKPPPRPVSFPDIPSPVNGNPPTNFSYVRTPKGIEVVRSFKEAYTWKEKYLGSNPSLEFSYKTNVLFNSCEQHLSELSQQLTEETKLECDMIVQELLNLRAHWGPSLLPLSMRNAFVREKVSLTVGHLNHRFRIDCIQFFEPIVFYGNSPGKPEDLVKLYVFVVYDLSNDEKVVVRYYLERSFLFDFYHVLCYFEGNGRGQLKPYGHICPSYWVIRQDMLESAKTYLEKTLIGKQSFSIPTTAS